MSATRTCPPSRIPLAARCLLGMAILFSAAAAFFSLRALLAPQHLASDRSYIFITAASICYIPLEVVPKLMVAFRPSKIDPKRLWLARVWILVILVLLLWGLIVAAERSHQGANSNSVEWQFSLVLVILPLPVSIFMAKAYARNFLAAKSEAQA